jgi:hypothetical protein
MQGLELKPQYCQWKEKTARYGQLQAMEKYLRNQPG